MTRKDIIMRGALEKLEEIVRSCVDSCNGNSYDIYKKG